MSNEKMREEFEEWLEDNSMFPLDSPRAAGYWSAWQASRAALCVELPKQSKKFENEEGSGADCEDAYNSALYMCKYAIESTGVKTK